MVNYAGCTCILEYWWIIMLGEVHLSGNEPLSLVVHSCQAHVLIIRHIVVGTVKDCVDCMMMQLVFSSNWSALESGNLALCRLNMWQYCMVTTPGGQGHLVVLSRRVWCIHHARLFSTTMFVKVVCNLIRKPKIVLHTVWLTLVLFLTNWKCPFAHFI